MPPYAGLLASLGGAATAVLPVSAAGHATLAALLIDLDADDPRRALVSLGAWLGVVVYLRSPLRELVRASRASRQAARADRRAEAVLVLGSAFATGLVGTLAGDFLAAWGREPSLVGASLLVTALALVLTFWAPDGDREAPTIPGALLVAAAQGAALLPGLSPPAFALSSLLLLGVRRVRAFELCFLMFIAATPAFFVRDGFRHLHQLATARGAAGVALMAVVVVASALIAAGCLYLLRRAVGRQLLPFFSLYMVPLGFATMALAYALS